MTGSIGWLVAASAALILSHVALSGTRLRGTLVGVLGERPFRGLFSLLSLAVLWWVVAAYNAAPYVGLWTAGHALKGLTWLIMAPAVWLAVCGLSSRNPAGRSAPPERDPTPHGILTVTRHPLMWGIALWAVAHMIANGDVASLVMFGGFLVLALAGLASQERKQRARHGTAWERFAAKTSLVPFAAALQGRTRIDRGGLGWHRILASAAVYAALVALHPYVIGVSPIP
jgi:uncharacterized membrane protein